MAKKYVTAQFVSEVVVTDPDTKLPVHVAIYKEEHGGMFGVDSSFLENTDKKVVSPFGNGIVIDEANTVLSIP
jgi:hypothetical protein